MREAIALKRWLAEQDPPLANEIFLDVDPGSGLQAGTRWKDALRRANARCEAVICLLSRQWEASHECKVEYRTAENLNKQIFVARLEPSTGDELTSEWQRCDLFGDGSMTSIDVGGGAPVQMSTEGLYRLRDGIRGAGIGAESFVWPPPEDPGRAPYRGWEPLQECDAAVFFGRDAQIVRALDAVRGIRTAGVDALFMVLGPSGAGKSSFLRAGLLPRLRREDRRFVVCDIVRPERNALTGQTGLAAAIAATRQRFGLGTPSLGDIKDACMSADEQRVASWLQEIRQVAADRLVDRGEGGESGQDSGEESMVAPTLVLPLDQAEELFSADAGEQAEKFLTLLTSLIDRLNDTAAGLVVAATIRTDRYEVMQTHPALAGVGTVLFDELKPMPATQFKETVVGPAQRATEGGRPLRVTPELVERLLADTGEGADTLPMLALTMSRLYADYGSTGELTEAHYSAMGGMRRVVQTEIDEVLSSDPGRRATELESLRAAFIPWLTTVNPDNDQPMRRVARWSDLPEPSRPLIDALVAKRLMVKDTRDGQAVVEVALESLLRQWDELAQWLREQRQELKNADDLERTAASWANSDHDPTWLLSGTRLIDAEALAASPGFRQRLASAADFLQASREAEDARLDAEEQRRHAELRAARERQNLAEQHAADLRRRSHVLRGVLAVTAVVAVIAVAGFLWANSASDRAHRQFLDATSLRLQSDAQGLLSGARPGGDERGLQEILIANKLASSPDETALHDALVDVAQTVKIIDTPGVVYGVRFSPDGQRIAAADGAGGVHLWDAESARSVADNAAAHSGEATAVAFSPDGALIASAGDNGVRLWDARSGAALGEPLGAAGGARVPVFSAAFSPDGRILASAGADRVVRLWNVASRTRIGELAGSQDAILSVAFAPDGRTLASAGGDGLIRMWDLATMTPRGKPLAGDGGEIYSVAFSPDGARIAAGDGDRRVRIWDIASGHTTVSLQLPQSVFAVAFDAAGERLAVGSGDGVIRIIDPGSGAAMGPGLSGHGDRVLSVAFSPDGRRLVSGSGDRTVRLWDVGHGTMLDTNQGGVTAIAVSPDGRRVATAGWNGTVRFWDPADGTPVGPALAADPAGLSTVVFSPDGDSVAAAGPGGTIRVWDAGTGRPVGVPMKVDAAVHALAFAPDGTRLAAAYGADVRLWDVRSGLPIGAAMSGHQRDVWDVEFSPDGTRLVTASGDQTVRQWDAQTQYPIGEPLVGHSDGVTGATFGPNGDWIVSAGNDGTIRMWDPGTAAALREPISADSGPLPALAVSPDGTRVVTGGADHSVRMWDLAAGEPLGEPLRGHDDEVWGVAFTPDGARVVSGGLDSILRFWPVGATEADLCAKLTVNMSHREWNEKVSPDIDYIAACPDLPIPPEDGS